MKIKRKTNHILSLAILTTSFWFLKTHTQSQNDVRFVLTRVVDIESKAPIADIVFETDRRLMLGAIRSGADGVFDIPVRTQLSQVKLSIEMVEGQPNISPQFRDYEFIEGDRYHVLNGDPYSILYTAVYKGEPMDTVYMKPKQSVSEAEMSTERQLLTMWKRKRQQLFAIYERNSNLLKQRNLEINGSSQQARIHRISTRIARMNPKGGSVRFQLSYLAFLEGKFDEALGKLPLSELQQDASELRRVLNASELAQQGDSTLAVNLSQVKHNLIQEFLLKARIELALLEYDDALTSYLNAYHLDPDNLHVADEYASVLNDVGMEWLGNMEFRKARLALESAVDVREKVVQYPVGDRFYQYYELIEHQSDLIEFFIRSHRINDANRIADLLDLTLKEQVKVRMDSLERNAPLVLPTNYHPVMAKVFSNLGYIKYLYGEYKMSNTHLYSAMRHHWYFVLSEEEQEAAHASKIGQKIKAKATTKVNLSDINTAYGAELEVAEFDSLDLLDRLARTYARIGDVLTAQYDVNTSQSVGFFEFSAPKMYEYAVDLYEELKVSRHGRNNPRIESGIAYVYNQWAKMYQTIYDKNIKNRAYAIKNFHRSYRIYSELAELDPRMYVPQQIKVMCDLFDFYASTEELEDEYYADSVYGEIQILLEKHSEILRNAPFQPDLANAYNHLGYINIQKKNYKLAEQMLLKSIKLYTFLDRQNDFIYLPARAHVYVNLSLLYLERHLEEPLMKTAQIGEKYAKMASKDIQTYIHEGNMPQTKYTFAYGRHARILKDHFARFDPSKKFVPDLDKLKSLKRSYNLYKAGMKFKKILEITADAATYGALLY